MAEKVDFPPLDAALVKTGAHSAAALSGMVGTSNGPHATTDGEKIRQPNKDKQKLPWVDVVKDLKAFTNGHKLKRVQGEEKVLREYDMSKKEEVWGICAIGYIMGRFPGFKAIEEVRKSWGVFHQFSMHESGWMIFKFHSEADRDKVLLNGPYETFGAPWLMREMPLYFNFGDDCFTKIPTWVRLPSLPLECWNERALSKIGSYIGDPIASDHCTAKRLRYSYARLLVEVDVTKDLVKEFDFFLPNGKHVQQRVQYEHEPILCGKCRRVGHEEKNCKVKERRKGRSKSRPRIVEVNLQATQPTLAIEVVQPRDGIEKEGETAQLKSPEIVKDNMVVEEEMVQPRDEMEQEGGNSRKVAQVEQVEEKRGRSKSRRRNSKSAGRSKSRKATNVEKKDEPEGLQLVGSEEVLGNENDEGAKPDGKVTKDRGKRKDEDVASSSIGDAQDWHKLWQPVQLESNDDKSSASLSEAEPPTEEKVTVAKATPKSKKAKKKKGKRGGGSPN